MGALTIIRKRPSDFISSHTPSPSPAINSNNALKKPRITYSSQVEVQNMQSSVDRLRKYPEPVGKLRRRDVHAPCRSQRRGFNNTMGNVIGGGVDSLWRAFQSTKDAALGTLRHFKLRKPEQKVERVLEEWSSEVVIIDELNEEVRSEDSNRRRGGESDVLGLVIQERDLDRIDANVVHSPLLFGREAYKELLSSLDKKYSPKLRTLDFEIKSNEAKLRAVRSTRKPTKEKKKVVEEEEEELLKKPKEDLLRELFVPLSEDEEGEVKTAFSNSNRRKVLVTHENSNIQITGEKLQCLRPGAWLNDEVINVYLELLKERERREPNKYLTCHFFNTFFYKKLIGGRNGYDYKAVKRWTSLRKLGYKLSECDKIFVPIHKEVHWCLAVINNKDKTFQYLDSLGGRDLQVLSILAKYYMDEVKDKCGQDINVNSWALEYVEDLPEQQNGFDCGVFMIKYADFYSRGMGLHFSQENMPYFRRRTAKEILRLQAQ